MNNRRTRAGSATCALAFTGILLPLSAQAAGPVYFDLGGLVLYSALYLLGLIIFPIVIATSKDKRMSSWIFAAYVIGPVLYIGIITQTNSIHNKQVMAEMVEINDGEQKNLDAFGTYCKARQKTIHSKVKPPGDISLAVRIDKNFTGIKWQFNAYPISRHMQRNPDACEKTGVKTLEEIYDGAYSEEKKKYEREIRRYSMCTSEKWTVTAESQSRYELVLGETSRTDPVPWGGSDGRRMSASSVRIIDRSTGEVLAEDTMYFLNYGNGEAGCPSGLPQLSALVTEVFSPP